VNDAERATSYRRRMVGRDGTHVGEADTLRFVAIVPGPTVRDDHAGRSFQ